MCLFWGGGGMIQSPFRTLGCVTFNAEDLTVYCLLMGESSKIKNGRKSRTREEESFTAAGLLFQKDDLPLPASILTLTTPQVF